MNSDSETVTHSSTIQKHPPTPHIVIREDDGSHTTFNDEVVPGFSDEKSPISQASSKGSTRGAHERDRGTGNFISSSFQSREERKGSE